MTRNKVQAIVLKTSWVMSCAYSQTGKFVASGGLDNSCSVYQLDVQSDPGVVAKPPVKELAHHDGYVSCISFLDNDSKVLTGSGDSKCILWDLEKASVLSEFDQHSADISSVAVSYDSRLFVSASVDTTVKLWDLRDGSTKPKFTFRNHTKGVNTVSFFPDENSICTSSDDETIRHFDLRSLSQMFCFEDKGSKTSTGAVFSKSGRVLFGSYEDGSIIAWDVLTGKSLSTVKAHDDRVSCLCMSPDGKVLCSGSWDMSIKIWA